MQFDMKSVAERPDELARPYLHHFLSSVYPHYDIVIWSATSMKWIEIKMRELRVSNHPDFKVTCFMDHQSMVSVCDKKGGQQSQTMMQLPPSRTVANEAHSLLHESLQQLSKPRTLRHAGKPQTCITCMSGSQHK